jgi:hypothetical protein
MTSSPASRSANIRPAERQARQSWINYQSATPAACVSDPQIHTCIALAQTLVPSIILAPSLVALFVSVHHSATPDKKVWSHAALAFACIYAPLCTVAYVVELSVVQPHVLQGQADQVALLTLAQYGTQPNTVFSAFDGRGYAFLSIACLFAAPIFGGSRLERWIRWMLVGTGVMGVPTILTYFVNPGFLWPQSRIPVAQPG